MWPRYPPFFMNQPLLQIQAAHLIYSSPIFHGFLATDLHSKEGFSSGNSRPEWVRYFTAERALLFLLLSYRSLLGIDLIHRDI